MTINEIFEEEFSNGRDFSFAWRIFLDLFYASTNEKRRELISPAPICLDDRRHLSYCSAGIHKLCREYGLALPEWVTDKSLILDEPYFPGVKTDLLKLVCLVESPPEFKMRNIFTTENVLTRT
ncbi:hypothetical protein [Cohnella silvisoli]|uniref:Uncharacterized protein n=1 Tax=Cohnella silvisoli TaxID=2873699 RepID=A0ABV1KMW0_9BACL|nr:hypothetical protein [Cohnella silvisoli]MCD9020246.1 hypothetical protein [Cohnella silvisoli]